MSGRRPLVVALGAVDPALAAGVLGDGVEFVARPGPEELAEAEGAIVRAGAVVDAALLARAPRLRVLARIGRRVGELAAAFGMRVLAHDPVSPPPAGIDRRDLGELAAASDVLTLHAPLPEATRHLVDAALAALELGRLGGIGLDVFDPEPPPTTPCSTTPTWSSPPT